MKSTLASTLHRITVAIAGLVLLAALAGYGGSSDAGRTLSLAPKLTGVGNIAESPADGPFEISSPAFEDGAPIPYQYTCRGGDIAPPLRWSAPLGAALVVDDPDAAREPYIHWIVIGIPPGPGSTGDNQIPGGGTALPNSAGHTSYSGPCPVPGTGIHTYRFTLYQLPATLELPPGLAGPEAVKAITKATTAQVQFTGTFER